MFGPRHYSSIIAIFIVAMIPRIVRIISAAVLSILGYDWDTGRSRNAVIAILTLNLITLITIITISQVKKDEIKQSNVLIRVWIPLEIATKVIEPIDQIFFLNFEESFFEYTQY